LYPTRCSFSFILVIIVESFFFLLFVCVHTRNPFRYWPGYIFGDISRGFMIVHVIFLLNVLSLVKVFRVVTHLRFVYDPYQSDLHHHI
jgi:hypothetical protein